MRHVKIIAAASALVGCLLSAGAAPQPPADNAKEKVFGYRFTGVEVPSGRTWIECVGADGRAVLEGPRGATNGRVTIEDGGKACFAYASDGYATKSCFDVLPAPGEGILFWDGERGIGYQSSAIEAGVSVCKGPDDKDT